MGKFYGAIGYAETKEDAPGVFVEHITERNHFGDILKNVSKYRDGENLNSDLTLENRFSIVADPFAYQNFYNIRYVQWLGAKWLVTSVEIIPPRIILSIGGVYNEQSASGIA